MNRKGADHIEIILAFIIFVSFILFALYFFNPGGNRSLDSSLSFTFNEIERNLSTDLDSYSVKINRDEIRDDKIVVQIEGSERKKALVKDYYGVRLDSAKEGNKIWVELDRNDFVFIELSEDIPVIDKTGKGSILREVEYTITSFISEKVISENKVLALNNSYYSDYEGLKNYFSIPRNSNFALILEFENKKIMAEKNVPSGIDVYSDNKRVKILNKNGGTSFGYLTIKVW